MPCQSSSPSPKEKISGYRGKFMSEEELLLCRVDVQ